MSRRTSDRRPADRRDRAMSSVVGVALLLGVTVVSLGVLTAGIGAVVGDGATSIAADRAATDLESALGARGAGVREVDVRFADGRLRPLDRTVRVFDDDGEVASVAANGLELTTDDRRVAFVDGGVAVGPPGNARLRGGPSVAVSDDAVLLSVTRLDVTSVSTVTASGRATVRLRTDVRHRRTDLGEIDDDRRFAVETSTPGAWERAFADRAGVTVLDRRDDDGDGVPSVAFDLPPSRTLRLVIHEVRVEVVES